MRALKLLADFVRWRWTPCVALVASSFLYVLLAVLFVPQDLSLSRGTKSVNIVNATDLPNTMSPTAPGIPRSTGFAAPRSAPRPVTPAPPQPVAAPPPPPEPPREEPQREEPPAPPPPPPPAIQPAQPEQSDEQGEEEGSQAPAPTPQPSRFASSKMRILPAIAAQARAAAAAQPEPASSSEEE